MPLDHETARCTLARWQQTLRLSDWDITLRLMPLSWRKSGDIKIDADDRKAVLMLNRRPRCENIDELVAHELLHLKLWGLDQMIEELIDALYGGQARDSKRSFAYTQFMKTLESTVEDLTKGFLTAAGCSAPLSQGRLRRQASVGERARKRLA